MSFLVALLSIFTTPITSLLSRLLLAQNSKGDGRGAADRRSAEIDGGPLINQKSLFSLLEQSLHKNRHGRAIVCMHQPSDHLSNLVQNDVEFQKQSDGDVQTNGVQKQPNGDMKHQRQHDMERKSNGDSLSDCLRLTYIQVHRTALRLAAGLMANGVQPHATVLILIPNGGEFALLFWTCIIMRLTIVSLDPSHLKMSESSELLNTMELLDPMLVVVPNAASAKAVGAAVQELRLAQPLLLSLEIDPSGGCTSLQSLVTDGRHFPMDQENLLAAARNDDPQRIHSIIFTSGTSGRPKGCPLRAGGVTHLLNSQSWLINRDNCALALQQAHSSRAIAPAQMLQTWKEGGTVVMSGRGFVIKDTIDAIVNHKVTFLVLTPAMVHALDQQLASQPCQIGSVRSIQIGGDAVTKDILVKCAAMFPHAKICINHGMTEGGGSFRWPFFDTPVSEIPYFGEICPIGKVAPGSLVRIWSEDTGSVAKRGEPGELHICCGSIIPYYLGEASETAFYEDRKGRWFNTGDIAMINSDSLLFILGRKKDTIRRAGVTIIPAAIESCLEKFTGSQVVVIPIAHHVIAHEPYAVLSGYGGKSEDEIKRHVRTIFGRDHALGGVASLQQLGLDGFPVNPTHKIVKSEVQAAVLKYLGRGETG
ncbi:MAG: hypothetical protein Q9190_000449 [Brigantiaea leucoxantha]